MTRHENSPNKLGTGGYLLWWDKIGLNVTFPLAGSSILVHNSVILPVLPIWWFFKKIPRGTVNDLVVPSNTLTTWPQILYGPTLHCLYWINQKIDTAISHIAFEWVSIIIVIIIQAVLLVSGRRSTAEQEVCFHRKFEIAFDLSMRVCEKAIFEISFQSDPWSLTSVWGWYWFCSKYHGRLEHQFHCNFMVSNCSHPVIN